MEDLVLEEGDGLKELSDWLFGRVADDNDVVVDKVPATLSCCTSIL
jgi:hypothetical protein